MLCLQQATYRKGSGGLSVFWIVWLRMLAKNLFPTQGELSLTCRVLWPAVVSEMLRGFKAQGNGIWLAGELEESCPQDHVMEQTSIAQTSKTHAILARTSMRVTIHQIYGGGWRIFRGCHPLCLCARIWMRKPAKHQVKSLVLCCRSWVSKIWLMEA